MTLSADILNQRSPYKLSQLGEFTFRFVTDQNIHYTVGFYKDTIFMDDGAYHYDHAFNVYRIYYGLYHPKTAQALLKKIEYNAFGDYVDEGLFMDIYDFKSRNDCFLEYDVYDKLSNIKAKSLFVSTNDNYFNYELDVLPFKDLVPGSIVLKQEDRKENYYFEEKDYAPVGEEVIAFLEQFK